VGVTLALLKKGSRNFKYKKYSASGKVISFVNIKTATWQPCGTHSRIRIYRTVILFVWV
jgi:hypothetical protein